MLVFDAFLLVHSPFVIVRMLMFGIAATRRALTGMTIVSTTYMLVYDDLAGVGTEQKAAVSRPARARFPPLAAWLRGARAEGRVRWMWAGVRAC